MAFNEDGNEQGGMGVAVGDYDHDGHLDIVKTNFAGDYPNLYRNHSRGIFEDIVVRAGLAVNPQYVAWGVGLVDFDNDGWSDMFQVNGHVYPEMERSQAWRALPQSASAVSKPGQRPLRRRERVRGPGVTAKHSSRGAAFGDIDNDGAMDVLIMNMGEPPSLLRNQLGNSNHWIKVRLQGTGSNRSAIGATLTVEAGKMKQTAAVLSQSSFLSHDDPRLHFGLGAAEAVDAFTVRWPNGAVERFPGSASNSLVLLVEGSGEVRSAPLPK